MARKKADNTAEIGFEEQIWKAADKLRGNIDASEYKNVVLGLIFLKYISDKFDQRYKELVAEGGSRRTATSTRRRASSSCRPRRAGRRWPPRPTRPRLARRSTRPCA